MKFSDEEARDSFHKLETFMQVICAMFESYCFEYEYEVELIDTNGNYTYFGIPEISDAAAESICDRMNHQFPRADKNETCKFEAPDFGVFEIFVTTSKDFKSLQ